MQTTLNSGGSAIPAQPDQTPANNSNSLKGFTFGSFDPNDKLVYPEILSPAEVLAGTLVTYTIRFQNTGERVSSFRVISANALVIASSRV